LNYPWGNTFECSRSNLDDETLLSDYVVSGRKGCDGYERTAPVGSFAQGVSWCGALDMAGNVWEWVADWYGPYPAAAQSNPTGPENGDDKVLRGGLWLYDGDWVRSAYRNWTSRASAMTSTGFGVWCRPRLDLTSWKQPQSTELWPVPATEKTITALSRPVPSRRYGAAE
jgi:serine/threonine-protein kinase